MKLYYHPISAYSQKTLIAFYEKDLTFTPEIRWLMEQSVRQPYEKMHRLGKIPVLIADDGEKIAESSVIIEYVDGLSNKGPRLIPTDPKLARRTRMLDRVFDNYVNDNMQVVLFDSWKPEKDRQPHAVAAARAMLDKTYAFLDEELAGRTWAAGEDFTLADCAAAPPLAYVGLVHPFAQYKNVAAYAARLAERPSFTRVVREAQPYVEQLLPKS